MAGRLANRSALLLLVGASPTSRRQFDLGGMGTVDSSRTFDIEAPALRVDSSRIFDLLGGVHVDSSRTFDILGALHVDSSRLFDIVAVPGSIPPPGIAPGPGPRAGINLEAVATPIDTTLAAAAGAGVATITVASAAGISAGTLLNIGGEYRNVQTVSGTTLTLYVALGTAHAIGEPVTDSRTLRPEVLDAAAAGAVRVSLARVLGLVPGMAIDFGGQSRTIADVSGGKRDGYVLLTAALSAPVAAGSYAKASVSFLPAMSVHDKAGQQLGLITAFSIRGTRTHLIGEAGNMDLDIPRTAPDVRLVHGDYLVAVGSSEVDDLWAGTMAAEQGVDGVLAISCNDAFDLTSTITVKYEDEPADGTPAATLYRKIVDLLNEQRGQWGELEWGIDTGSSVKPYYGDIKVEGDPFDIWRQIAAQSNTEFAWRATISGGKLAITLAIADEFDAGTGIAIADGSGGNVQGRPTYVRNFGAIVNAIRLTGASTDVAKYLPEWAKWGVHEFEPVVERSVNPGEYRKRRNLELRVDWGLGRDMQKALAAKTEAQLWALYRTFVYAYHATYGRPYHEGWKYPGPPSDLEPRLTTGRGWRTRMAFVEYLGEAAASVMLSQPEGQILVVLYDRLAAEQTIRRAWFSEAGSQTVLKLHIHGYAKSFDVVGGVITAMHIRPYDHSAALVSKSAVTLMWPGEGPDSAHPETTYHTLRRVVSLSEDGAITEDSYFDCSYVRGPTSGVYYDPPTNLEPVFTRPTIGDAPYIFLSTEAAPDNVDLDADFVTKVYPFEQRRIRDWDPRRDGVGAYINRLHIRNNAPSTALRWHIVPWNVTGDYQGTLLTGISASATEIYVDSIYGLPRPQDVPYVLTLDEDPNDEKVEVTAMSGTKLTVKRGAEGTTPTDHEPGAQVTYELPDGVDAWDGFVVHTEVKNAAGEVVRQLLDSGPLWPEGEAWADEVLAHLQRPDTRLALAIVNRDGGWSTVALGSRHAASVTTEGIPPSGYSGTVRVIGYALDEASGLCELITEEVV